MSIFPLKRNKPDAVDRAANRVANQVRRQRRQKIARRKWAAETAMMCIDEATAAERIELAKKIEAYVWDGDE